jgi:Flp pilus assembly protein TadB
MNDPELKELWHRQPPASSGPASGEALVANTKAKMKKMDRTLFWRDTREYVACAFIVWWFGLRGPGANNALTITGRVVVVAGCFLIAGVLYYSQRRQRPKGSTAPVREALESELDKINWQIMLLRSVLWWYVLPISVGCALVVIGTAMNHAAMAVGLGTIVFVCLFVCWINQLAVKRTLVPLQKQLQETINSIATL